jgi:hypothetical protein
MSVAGDATGPFPAATGAGDDDFACAICGSAAVKSRAATVASATPLPARENKTDPIVPSSR